MSAWGEAGSTSRRSLGSRRLTRIIRGPTLAQSASEGGTTTYHRLRFGLVYVRMRQSARALPRSWRHSPSFAKSIERVHTHPEERYPPRSWHLAVRHGYRCRGIRRYWPSTAGPSGVRFSFLARCLALHFAATVVRKIRIRPIREAFPSIKLPRLRNLSFSPR